MLDKTICRIANKTRKYKLHKLDPLLRKLHNPDKRQQHSINQILRLSNGLFYHIDTASYLEWTLFFYGEYDSYIQSIFRSLLRQGDITIDVGANIGIHTLEQARIVGNTGTVYSFEPHPVIYEKLKKNIKLNHMHWVEAFPIALSDQSGNAQLFGFDNANQGTSSLENKMSSSKANPLTIQTQTLDSFVTEQKINALHLLKVDIEGHELKFFLGALKTIAQFKPIIVFEDSEKNIIGRKNIITKLLQKLSYTMYAIHYNHLQEISLFEDKEIATYNFLALPSL